MELRTTESPAEKANTVSARAISVWSPSIKTKPLGALSSSSNHTQRFENSVLTLNS
jgi:hypothetical protein